MEKSEKIANVLSQIHVRFCSLFFGKLILLEKENSNPIAVRHYDIECEAVRNIRDVLDTRIKANLCRAFELVKNYGKARFTRKRQDEKKIKGTPQRKLLTDLNKSGTYITGSFDSASKRTQENAPSIASVDVSMEALMRRMKTLSSKMVTRNSNLVSLPEKENANFAKRDAILEKLGQLQNELKAYLDSENENSCISQPSQFTPTHKATRSFAYSHRRNESFNSLVNKISDF